VYRSPAWIGNGTGPVVSDRAGLDMCRSEERSGASFGNRVNEYPPGGNNDKRQQWRMRE